MSIEDRANFEKNWAKFITRLKGQVMAKTEKQELSYPLLKLLLSDAVIGWETKDEENGRWLMNYTAEEPTKGQTIHRILTEDMQFDELQSKKVYHESLNYVVPIVGAVAGLGISTLLGAGVLGKTLSTVVPAAVLYPSSKAIGDNLNKTSSSHLLEEYIAQLEKYKLSVISVIES